jgi:hypothetical protein
MIGVLVDGSKEAIAIEDGYRESTESWASVLRDLKRRDLRAPVPAIGDGALGFWATLIDAARDHASPHPQSCRRRNPISTIPVPAHMSTELNLKWSESAAQSKTRTKSSGVRREV